MLNIVQSESVNSVRVEGILKDLDIAERTTSDGRDYITCKATIKVDQEVNGKMLENEIPIRMFSMRLKKDGAESKIYYNILNYRNQFTSLAATQEGNERQASRVLIDSGRLEENIWIDQSSGEPRTSYQITTNFLKNAQGDNPEDEATFELTGVVLNKTRETDANGDETGRLKVKFAVVRYGGKVDVINLIAESANAVNFIETNWEDGDTVQVTGAVSINVSKKVYFEEQGFGDPIKRIKTETRHELIILGGSPAGFDESNAYDANEIKSALSDRQARVEQLKTAGKAKKPSPAKSNQFGF